MSGAAAPNRADDEAPSRAHGHRAPLYAGPISAAVHWSACLPVRVPTRVNIINRQDTLQLICFILFLNGI